MPRKKLDIDATQVEQLAQIGATNIEIGQILGCSEATIRGRFCEELAKGRANRKTRLRKKQFDVAMQGNCTMLIWLGKQELGQQERVENVNINHDVEDLEAARDRLKATENGRELLRVVEGRTSDTQGTSETKSA